jgi:hypothetical protein
MVYPPKRDLWIAFLVLPSGCLMIGGGILLLSLLATGANPPGAILPLGLLLLTIGAMLLWMMFSTAYEIDPSDLRVRCGPLRWRIPLQAIEEVAPSRGIFSDAGWGWSVIWSLDRLRITYRNKRGWRLFALISPKDKEGFLAELAQANPNLQAIDDRLVRVASEPDDQSPP